MGRQGKWEYFRAVYARYRRADRRTKEKMSDEFCACACVGSLRRQAARSRLRAVDESDHAFPFRCLPLATPLDALVAGKTLFFRVATKAGRRSQFAFF